MYINDRAVDLTENLDFNYNPERKINFRRHFGSSRLTSDFEDLGGRYPYYTGSAEMIRIYIMYESDIENKCDRCGRKLLPWEQILCSECDNELDEKYGSPFPWERRSREELLEMSINNILSPNFDLF